MEKKLVFKSFLVLKYYAINRLGEQMRLQNQGDKTYIYEKSCDKEMLKKETNLFVQEVCEKRNGHVYCPNRY